MPDEWLFTFGITGWSPVSADAAILDYYIGYSKYAVGLHVLGLRVLPFRLIATAGLALRYGFREGHEICYLSRCLRPPPLECGLLAELALSTVFRTMAYVH